MAQHVIFLKTYFSKCIDYKNYRNRASKKVVGSFPIELASPVIFSMTL